MKKERDQNMAETLRPEYDFSAMKGGRRGKYASRYARGTNLIPLEPDVAKIFTDAGAVNQALRSLIKIARADARFAH